MEEIFIILKGFIESAGGNYDIVSKILIVIGLLRVLFKPLMSLVQAIVQITPSIADDGFLAKIMENKFYKIFAYALDWSASIKLPKKDEPKL